MIVSKSKYVITSKNFPLTFYDEFGDCYCTFDYDDIFFDYMEVAKDVLSNFDSPDKYQILEVNIRYEI